MILVVSDVVVATALLLVNPTLQIRLLNSGLIMTNFSKQLRVLLYGLLKFLLELSPTQSLNILIHHSLIGAANRIKLFGHRLLG